MDTPSPSPETPDLPPHLRRLQRLVTVLTVTMIAGVVTLVGLLVIRLGDTTPPLPSEISLPEGITAIGFSQGEGWYAILTDNNLMLIYNRFTGELAQEVAIPTLPAQ